MRVIKKKQLNIEFIFFFSRVQLLFPQEWEYLSNNYTFDKAIKVQKIYEETFIFEPFLCEECMQEKEDNKLFFQNKKITIRQKEDSLEDVQIIEADYETGRSVS